MNEAFLRGFEKAASQHEKQAIWGAGLRAIGSGVIGSGKAIYNTIAKPVGKWIANNKMKTLGGALTVAGVAGDTKGAINATMANKAGAGALDALRAGQQSVSTF